MNGKSKKWIVQQVQGPEWKGMFCHNIYSLFDFFLQDFIEFRKNRNKMLRSRKNQILLAFSFWPEMAPRPPSNIYELRSYTLKVHSLQTFQQGSLIVNSWSDFILISPP